MAHEVPSGSIGKADYRWPEVVQSPLFALVDLGLALTAGALWYVSRGQLGWLPLLAGAWRPGQPGQSRATSRSGAHASMACCCSSCSAPSSLPGWPLSRIWPGPNSG